VSNDILLQLLISQIKEKALLNALGIAIAELDRITMLEGDHALTTKTLEEIYSISIGASAALSSLIDVGSKSEETLH